METNRNPVAQAYQDGWEVNDEGEWWKPEVGQRLIVDYGSDEFADNRSLVVITRVDDDSFDVQEPGKDDFSWTIYLSEMVEGLVLVHPQS